jgi:hypothetical protein
MLRTHWSPITAILVLIATLLTMLESPMMANQHTEVFDIAQLGRIFGLMPAKILVKTGPCTRD